LSLFQVQIYSPWNLHEETPGNWDFENGFLNLAAFLKAVKEADMFVIARPGPYICAEWEMGGFPAWLLRDPQMRLRSNYKPYLAAVEKYYTKVLSILKDFEFSTKGGPVIAFQLENEYGGVRNENDKEYLYFLKDTVVKSGFKELLFTSDPNGGAQHFVDGIEKNFRKTLLLCSIFFLNQIWFIMNFN
jgi:beta-galactosidase